MTYSYTCFGALTGWSFWYGCMLGVMVPPGLRPTRASLFDERRCIDESQVAAVAALTQRKSHSVSVRHPTAVMETQTPRPLRLAA
jgi:hypothetical protein